MTLNVFFFYLQNIIFIITNDTQNRHVTIVVVNWKINWNGDDVGCKEGGLGYKIFHIF